MKQKDRLAPLTKRDVKVPKELQPHEGTPVGTPVRVYRDNGEVFVTKTRSKVEVQFSGRLAVFVGGMSGYYAVDCVEVLDEHTAGGAA